MKQVAIIFDSEDVDMFLRNVDWLLTDYVAFYLRRQNFITQNCFRMQRSLNNIYFPSFVETEEEEAHRWFLSSACLIQSTCSHPISWRPVLRSGVLNGLFSSGIPTAILYAFLISHMRATCSNCLTVFDRIMWIMWDKEHTLEWRAVTHLMRTS
jgi:hypothetical protein